jgi:hypothetical protein
MYISYYTTLAEIDPPTHLLSQHQPATAEEMGQGGQGRETPERVQTTVRRSVGINRVLSS